MPECPPDKIVTDDRLGLRVCAETGEVLEENIISEEPEWRAYTDEEKNERSRAEGVVSPILGHMGVGARFGAFTGGKSALSRVRGFRGKPLDKVGRRRLRREEREALKFIHDISRRLSLPYNIRDEAAHFYRRMLEKGLTRGYNVLACVIVSFYVACRISKIPCKIEDFIVAAKTSYELGGVEIEMLRRDVVSVYKKVSRSMDLRFPIIGLELYVEKLAGKLGIPGYVVVDAVNMLGEARRRGYMLKGSPMGIAGGLLYLAARKHDLKITQDRIAEAAGVTHVTVRNRARELSKYVN